ncbi:uncharacterized protein [Branchiostoma lanceolatum]|uniref:uncharacterized protein n=1 Tax=Branchiostoma lanceolatum TaxID=7740 RepID=UPI0034564624
MNPNPAPDNLDVVPTEIGGVELTGFRILDTEYVSLPEIRNKVLYKSPAQIYNKQKQLNLQSAFPVSPRQFMILKERGAVDHNAKSCSMISKEDAEKLCQSFRNYRSRSRIGSLGSPIDFRAIMKASSLQGFPLAELAAAQAAHAQAAAAAAQAHASSHAPITTHGNTVTTQANGNPPTTQYLGGSTRGELADVISVLDDELDQMGSPGMKGQESPSTPATTASSSPGHMALPQLSQQDLAERLQSTMGEQLCIKHVSEYGVQQGSLIPKYQTRSDSKCIMCKTCGIFFSPSAFLKHLHDEYGKRIESTAQVLQLDLESPSEEQYKMWMDFQLKLKGSLYRKRALAMQELGIMSPELKRFCGNNESPMSLTTANVGRRNNISCETPPSSMLANHNQGAMMTNGLPQLPQPLNLVRKLSPPVNTHAGTNGNSHGEHHDSHPTAEGPTFKREDPVCILETAQELLALAAHKLRRVREQEEGADHVGEWKTRYLQEKTSREQAEERIKQLEELLEREQKMRSHLEAAMAESEDEDQLHIDEEPLSPTDSQ